MLLIIITFGRYQAIIIKYRILYPGHMRKMKSGLARSVAVLSFLFFMTSLTFHGIAAETPPDNATATYHWIEITQGDDPDTTAIEDAGLMTVTDTMLYSVPYNVSKVYIHVPEGGTMASFQEVHGTYNDSTSGLSEYPNWYYWEFSATANRRVEARYVHDESLFFENGSFNATRIDVAGDRIKLIDGVDQGEFTSQAFDVVKAVDVHSVKVRLDTDLPDNVTISVSNDDGANWLQTTNGSYADFTTSGTSIRYKLELHGTTTLRPRISNVTVDYKYTPSTTTLGLTAKYHFTSILEKPSFSVNKQLLYDIDKVSLLLYVDSGNSVESENITWANQSAFEPAMWDSLQKPGKDFHMGLIPPGSSFSLSVSPGPASNRNNDMLYFGLPILIIILLAAFFYLQRREKRDMESETKDHPPKDDDENQGGSPIDDDGDRADSTNDDEPIMDSIEASGDRAKLIKRKDKILKMIRKLDQDLENGSITKKNHERLKNKFRGEAVQIMKKLDVIVDDASS